MSQERQPYIRPYVMRLEYTTDARVSMAQPCKQEGDTSGGPSADSCLSAGQVPPPCREYGS